MKKFMVTTSVIVDSMEVEVWANNREEAEDMAMEEVHTALCPDRGVDFDYTIIEVEIEVIEDTSAARFARVGGI